MMIQQGVRLFVAVAVALMCLTGCRGKDALVEGESQPAAKVPADPKPEAKAPVDPKPEVKEPPLSLPAKSLYHLREHLGRYLKSAGFSLEKCTETWCRAHSERLYIDVAVYEWKSAEEAKFQSKTDGALWKTRVEDYRSLRVIAYLRSKSAALRDSLLPDGRDLSSMSPSKLKAALKKTRQIYKCKEPFQEKGTSYMGCSAEFKKRYITVDAVFAPGVDKESVQRSFRKSYAVITQGKSKIEVSIMDMAASDDLIKKIYLRP